MIPLDCAACIDRLHDLMDVRRDPRADASCEEHLASCDSCSHEARLLMETERILVAEPKIFPPADLKARIMADVAEAAVWRPAPRGEWLRVAAAILICSVSLYGLTLAAGFGLDRAFDPSTWVSAGESFWPVVAAEFADRTQILWEAVSQWPSGLPSDPAALLPDFFSSQTALFVLVLAGAAALGLNAAVTVRTREGRTTTRRTSL